MLGLEVLSTLTIFILGRSAPTKASATAKQGLVSASLVMKVLLVSVLFAPTSAVNMAHAGPRSFLPQRLEGPTLYRGMQTNMSDASVMPGTEVLLVTCVNVPQEETLWMGMATRRAENVQEEDSVITVSVSANASPVFTEPDASIRQLCSRFNEMYLCGASPKSAERVVQTNFLLHGETEGLHVS